MIKIATFNLENLFVRPTAMKMDDDTGKTAIEDHALACTIINKDIYTPEDKVQLLELCQKYKWHYSNPPKNALVQFKKIRGQLFTETKTGELSITANGRGDWVGWVELLKEDISWKSTYNTGRVINEIKPDILITVEVEDRPTLEKFNQQVLKPDFNIEYPHVMVIDGNDERGIDIGIMSMYPIIEIRSHVDDLNAEGNKIFSRDCAEYDVLLSENKRIVIIPNHFKSKRNGDDKESRDRRQSQAIKAHEIGMAALNRSQLVLIGGDLNDTPQSVPIKEVLKDGFVDVIDHPSYPQDRKGTYDTGLDNNKIDYLIMSPALRGKLTDTGIERRGTYHPKLWASFDTVTKSSEEASDHHLVWATFNL
jgi:endonuclease/exonuclease/phosphatase family metal-dependent hydrolase